MKRKLEHKKAVMRDKAQGGGMKRRMEEQQLGLRAKAQGGELIQREVTRFYFFLYFLLLSS